MLFRLFLTLFLLASGAQAEQGDALKGLKDIHLVIEELEEDAGKCGLTESEIRKRISEPILSQTKLGLVPDSRAYLMVTVTTLLDNDLCASNISLAAYTWLIAKPSHAAAELPVQVVLWEGSNVATDKMDAKGKDTLETVESIAKAFSELWVKMNP